MNILRTIIGFLIAPVAPAILVAVAGDYPTGVLTALFAYPVVLVLGAPAHLLLRKLTWLGWANYVTGGFLAGVLSGFLYGLILVMSDYFTPGTSAQARAAGALLGIVKEPLPLLFIGFLGAFGALCFWLIARPDTSRNTAEPLD